MIALCSNVLASRFYVRLDVTPSGLYSLSDPTRQTLESLSERVRVIVFLAQSHPEMGAVQRLLAQYEAASRLVSVRYVDPDRQPARFVALQSRYRLGEGRAEQGRLVSDAALIVARGEDRWVVTDDDLFSYDASDDTVQPRLELAVTEGFRQVLFPQPRRACFTRGHGEPSASDGGATGLGALRHTLEKNNFEVSSVLTTSSGADADLGRCDLLIVAAPAQPFGEAAARHLAGAARRGASLLVAAGPRLSQDEEIAPTGLEPALLAFGVAFDPLLVFERDPDAALPAGLGGEVFFATPARHEITRGLVQGEARHRVLVQVSQALAGGGAGQPLLSTSSRAFGVRSARVLAGSGVQLDDVQRDSEGPFVVATAAEMAEPSNRAQRAARLVVLASPSPLLGASFHDPSLVATRRFVESAVAWLSERPPLVHLPEKPVRQVSMPLTEAGLVELGLYVMVYMPLTALSLGALVLFRRRHDPSARGQRRTRGSATRKGSDGSNAKAVARQARSGKSEEPKS